MKQGLFVVLEGNEYVGKTTQAQAVAETLLEQGYEVVVVREPGGTPFAELMRTMLHDSKEHQLCPVSEIFLIAAGRRDLMDKVVIPALKEGKIVICDRHIHSTYAWQVWPFRETCPEAENAFYSTVQVTVGQMGAVPQVFLLNITPEERARREAARSKDHGNAFDSDPRMPLVNEAYENFKQDPSLLLIDAERPAEVITGELVDMIKAEYEVRQTGSQYISQEPPAEDGEAEDVTDQVEDPNEDQALALDEAALRKMYVTEPHERMLFTTMTNPMVIDSGIDTLKTAALLRKWADDSYNTDLPVERRGDVQQLANFAQFLQHNTAQMLSGQVGFLTISKSFDALPAEEIADWLASTEAMLNEQHALLKEKGVEAFELGHNTVVH